MELMTPREKWTDDCLDEFDKKVDAGFARVDADIRDLKGGMNQRFDKVDGQFDKVDDRFEAMSKEFNDRFDRLNGRLLAAAVVIIAAFIGPHAF